MDQIKIGNFLKELRKENGFTQEQLAQYFNVSSRTVSRWECGRNMPDLDILIEMCDYYEVDLRELLDGERKEVKMNQELEETVLKVADYSNEEKIRLTKILHFFSWIGVICFIIFMVLEGNGLAEKGVYAHIASFCQGVSFGILVITVIYTSRYMAKIKNFKMRMIKR